MNRTHRSIGVTIGLLLVATAGISRAGDSKAVDPSEPLVFVSAEAIGLPAKLTLAKAREIAVESNPEMKAAIQRLRAAVARVAQARSALLPGLELTADFTHIEEAPTWPTQGLFDLAPYQTYALQAQLGWVLYDGLGRQHSLSAARHGERAEQHTYDNVRRLLSRAVAVAFYQAMLAQENMRIAGEDADFNAKLTDDAEKRRAAGAAGKDDVLNFQIRQVQAESRHKDAERDYAIARIALAELLGLSDSRLPDEIGLVLDETGPYAGSLPEIEAEVQHALGRRADVLALQERLEQARKVLASARSQYQPKVSLSAAYGMERQDDLAFDPEDDTRAFAGVQVSWSPYTGGRRGAQCDEASAGVEEARQAMARVRNGVYSEIRQQHESLATALQQVEMMNRVLAMTQEVRGDVLLLYQRGKATLTRLNEAHSDVVKADAGLALTRIRARLAEEDLSVAAGRLSGDQGSAQE